MTSTRKGAFHNFATRITIATGQRPWVPFALVPVIGLLDFMTGPDVSFGIFYLLPVVLVAWWQGRRSVGAVAAIAALVWLVVDLVGRQTNPYGLVSIWNALTRFGIFWLVGLATQHARALQVRQSDLMNCILHDLSNPLMTFMTTLKLVVEDKSETSSSVARECVELCRLSAKRMETLINSILDLSRLEEGKMPIKMQSISVAEAINGAIHETSVFARSENIELRSEIATGVQTVRADPVLLHRILVNLLTNAIKASPEGTCVRIRAQCHETDQVVLSVIDAGSGIPRSYLSRVFDRFVQVQMSKSGSSSGFGLGLAFCRLASLAQRGRIWIENIAENGASVSVALPASDRA